ncbi:MAG: hypothetical protein UFR15_01455 [Succiniclasticum sp.]|nr:hypothetical protein [Succiniclasticum sp.]
MFVDGREAGGQDQASLPGKVLQIMGQIDQDIFFVYIVCDVGFRTFQKQLAAGGGTTFVEVR